MATSKNTTKKTETPKAQPKELKIKMLATYISTSLILMEGKEYTIPTPLASLLIKNREAVEC